MQEFLIAVHDEDIINGTFEIPDTVHAIGDLAFAGCENLTSIIIPKSVTSIGAWAFAECVKLKSITIPDNVTRIGDFAFVECESLEEIRIPESLTLSRNWFDEYTNPDCIVHHGNKKYKVEDIIHYF